MNHHMLLKIDQYFGIRELAKQLMVNLAK